MSNTYVEYYCCGYCGAEFIETNMPTVATKSASDFTGCQHCGNDPNKKEIIKKTGNGTIKLICSIHGEQEFHHFEIGKLNLACGCSVTNVSNELRFKE